MINFAVGPVQMTKEIRGIGAEEIPYFRTPEFSGMMKENESILTELMSAGQGSRAVFLTASGTAAMEAAVMNLFTKEDKLLVVNGGSFGARFVKICRVHGIAHREISLDFGGALTGDKLAPFDNQGFTGLLVNMHETSSGVLYDMDLISDFCKRNHLCLVVDAISSFLADEFDMEKWGVDLVLTGSQKALALPPGMSVLVLSEKTVKRVEGTQVCSLYFDLKEYLKDGERGQTPFTPAVSVLIQMNRRLKEIHAGGLLAEQERIRALARDFRERIKGLPFELVSEAPSNAVTTLRPTGKKTDQTPVSAREIFAVLKDEYDIYVCPNGGELADQVFRVGHIGNLTIDDNKCLVNAFLDLHDRGIL